jgi:hypothetical protein
MLENNVKRISEALRCPVSNSLYRNAQIVNCDENHSFSFEAIIAMFENMHGKSCEKLAFCPLCPKKS